MYVAQGTAYCLFGSEESPTLTVSNICRVLLVAWRQGTFTPGPLFPYTYEQVMTELAGSLFDDDRLEEETVIEER